MVKTEERMAELKQYKREEVKNLNGKGKTLIILHDHVYDVTDFLNEHPGGEEVLLEHGGKDGSDDFDDVGHSADAFDMMKNYIVGEIVESERRNNKPKKGWASNYNSKTQAKNDQGSGLSVGVLLAGLVILIAGAYYYL